MLGGERGGRCGHEDEIDPEPDQFGGELREALRVAFREPALEDEVLPFDIPALTQPVQERIPHGGGWGIRPQEADPVDLARRLRCGSSLGGSYELCIDESGRVRAVDVVESLPGADAQIVEALQLGARGVVLKDSATQLLLKAIHTVMSGEYWVGRESVSNLVQYLRTLMQSSNDEARQRKFGLTPRELEIVSAVVAGYSNKEIAEYFKISEDTVKHHLSNIFDKLGVSTRLELALFAVNQALPLKSIA